jgi:hypothetical protein
MPKKTKVCKQCGLPDGLCICEDLKAEMEIADILKCTKCGAKFRKIDDYTYEPTCDCIKKKIRISVG